MLTALVFSSLMPGSQEFVKEWLSFSYGLLVLVPYTRITLGDSPLSEYKAAVRAVRG